MARGRKRLNKRPSMATLQKRCRRAMEGEPTMKKRKDIITYIRALKMKINRYGRKNKTLLMSIKYRIEQLFQFDYKFGKKRAIIKMKALKITGSYEDKVQEVIKRLRAGQKVEGFTLLPTTKVKGHPTMIHVLDLPDGKTLCVQTQKRVKVSDKEKQNLIHVNK